MDFPGGAGGGGGVGGGGGGRGGLGGGTGGGGFGGGEGGGGGKGGEGGLGKVRQPLGRRPARLITLLGKLKSPMVTCVLAALLPVVTGGSVRPPHS